MLNIYNKSSVKDYNYNKLLHNKRVALVGPSSNTTNTKQGDLIESYDLVVRLNKTFDIPLSRYKDIGKRTDILYNSMNTTDFPGQNDFTPKLIQKLKSNNLKYISSPYPFMYPFDNDILKFIEINENQIKLHISDIVLYKYLVSVLKCRPYTGTCAIIDLLNYPIKELYITGIDCYLNQYYNEYRNISKKELKNLRNNHIHKNLPQLEFIKNLAINDSRLKLDSFLDNYFFKKFNYIYKNITIKPYIKFISSINLNETILKIKKLTENLNVLYSFKNKNYDNVFLINNSINYSGLETSCNAYINITTNDTINTLNINNNIQLIIDLSNKINTLQKIEQYTDIKQLIFIDYSLIKYIINKNIFKKFNIVFINILILCNLFKKIIYIDYELLDKLSKKELELLYYIQYLNKIKIIKI